VTVLLFLGFVAALFTGALDAQNLLDNPSFDVDTSSWNLEVGGALLWTDLLEASGCANSGSALISSEGDEENQTAAIAQCVTLHGEENLYASVQHRGYGTFHLLFVFTTAINCAAGSIGTITASEPQDPDAWNLLTMLSAVPANAHGVLVIFSAQDPAPHGLSLDDAMLTKDFPIFLDGFDGNDPGDSTPCRWGA
jgi:hypothetical protein